MVVFIFFKFYRKNTTMDMLVRVLYYYICCVFLYESSIIWGSSWHNFLLSNIHECIFHYISMYNIYNTIVPSEKLKAFH